MSTLLGCFLAVACFGEPPAAAGVAECTNAIDDFKADVKEYVMRLDARPNAPFELREEPLLHWTNPARTGEDGAVFVWLLDGRPQVIGSVFTYRLGDVIRRKHEYHSLAAGPLVATYRGDQVWAPRGAGVTFEPVPDAPAVPASPRARLSQMKSLARDFAASLEELNGERQQLRLLTQPLLRYESHDKTVDGAMFSFTLGTDPEVILMLEGRLDRGPWTWQYALARYHFVELRASYRDREVWRAEAMPREVMDLEIGTPKFQNSVYATYHTKSTLATD